MTVCAASALPTCAARIAIAPTGLLSVAQVRLALVNRDLARDAGGALALRWDDIGPPDAAMAERIRQDLRWLGISWDAEFHQSERAAIYAQVIRKLQADARLYPCFENDEELRFKRERRARQGKPVVYDRAMLKLTPAQRAAAEANGKRPYWRFLLSDREITWKDIYGGRQQVKLPSLSDPVLIGADGVIQPSLAAAIDDVACGIGLLARSADDVANSAIQADIRAALGANPGGIALAHLPPLLDTQTGKRDRGLEKRPIRHLQHDGVEASALVAYLTEMNDPAAAPCFDSTQLLALNRQCLSMLAYDAVAARLPTDIDAALWQVMRSHIDFLPEARLWRDIARGEIVALDLADAMIDGGEVFLASARAQLPPEPWGQDSWAKWLAVLQVAPGDARVTLLYHALTGEAVGPAMEDLLPLMGRERCARRLAALMFPEHP